jgi:quinoprotein glucose dehydrogenase
MLNRCRASALLLVLLASSTFAHEARPVFADASEEAGQIMKKYKLPPGLVVDVWAAEPMLAHPVAICVDQKGRVYVSQTFRFSDGISGGGDKDYGALDIRGHMDWVEQDLSNKTVEDRVAMLKRNLGADIARLQRNPERVQLIEDRDGDGKADYSSVFNEDFKEIPDGAAEGILAYKGNVYFTNIPHLWLLRDEDGDGKAEVKKSLLYGFGPRIAYLGHDLHGLVIGPDGKLYFSVGDRGYHVEQNGKTWHGSEWGAVFRCDLDGSNFEVFATGLRNPQELAFDDFGNLWTADNNADKGDPARWVYIVEGGDCGWRGGYQYISWPNNLGPWLAENHCQPPSPTQAAYLVPPVGTIGAGPSGLCHYPGTGLGETYRGHFFECDFRGDGGGVYDIWNEPLGAGFKMAGHKEFFWQVPCTDICFAPDSSMLASVWVGGIQKTGKGRIYRIRDPKLDQDAAVLEVKKLLNDGFDQRPVDELTKLLAHADQRVRQEAQFALSAKGDAGLAALLATASDPKAAPLARLQGIWGVGQVARRNPQSAQPLIQLLADADGEVRAQAYRVLGDVTKLEFAWPADALDASKPRTTFFAIQAMAKHGAKEKLPAIAGVLREMKDIDPWLRFSVIYAFEKMADDAALAQFARDAHPQVRLAACVALRRLNKPQVAEMLNDGDPLVVVEAARAIADVPIDAALPALAKKLEESSDERVLMRAVSAHNRLGTPADALALAAFAARENAPEKPRTLALRLLLRWAKPDVKDPIVGLYRPLPERDGNAASSALRSLAATLVSTRSEMVFNAACDAIEAYKLTEAGDALSAVARDDAAKPQARVRSLKALFEIGDARVADVVDAALKSKHDLVRKEAQRIQAQLKPNEGAAVLAAILNKPDSSLTEKQGALQTLAGLKDAKSAALAGEWLKKLNAGAAPAELQLEILEAAAGRAELKNELEAYQKALKPDDLLADYRETLQGGDAAAGRKIFMEKTEAQCLRCHRIGSDGGDVGPQLGDIGKRGTREYILESIVAPNHKIAAGFETLIVKLADGKVHVGIKKGETETELELLCPPDQRVKIAKSQIVSTKTGPSTMPEDLAKLITKRDLRNLVEFLASQK